MPFYLFNTAYVSTLNMVVKTDKDLTELLLSKARFDTYGDIAGYDISAASAPRVDVVAGEDIKVKLGALDGKEVFTSVGQLVTNNTMTSLHNVPAHDGKTHVYVLTVGYDGLSLKDGQLAQQTTTAQHIGTLLQSLIQQGTLIRNVDGRTEIAEAITSALPKGHYASLCYVVLDSEGNAQCYSAGTNRLLVLRKGRTDGSNDPLNEGIDLRCAAIRDGVNSTIVTRQRITYGKRKIEGSRRDEHYVESAVDDPIRLAAGDRLIIYDGWEGNTKASGGPRESLRGALTREVYQALCKGNSSSSDDLVRSALAAYKGVSLRSPEKQMVIITRRNTT